MGTMQVRIVKKTDYEVDAMVKIEQEKDATCARLQDEAQKHKQDIDSRKLNIEIQDAAAKRKSGEADDALRRKLVELDRAIQSRQEETIQSRQEEMRLREFEKAKRMLDVHGMELDVKLAVDRDWERDVAVWNQLSSVNNKKSSDASCYTYDQLKDQRAIVEHVDKLMAELPGRARAELKKTVLSVVEVISDPIGSVAEAVRSRVDIRSFNMTDDDGSKYNMNMRYAMAFRYNKVSADKAAWLGYFSGGTSGSGKKDQFLIAVGYQVEFKIVKFVEGGLGEEKMSQALGRM